MAEIICYRTIRPSSRLETSKNYKIDTKVVLSRDTLTVNIDHKSKSLKKSFYFKGSDVDNRSITSFRVSNWEIHINISWSGVQPIETISIISVKEQTPKEQTNSENHTPLEQFGIKFFRLKI